MHADVGPGPADGDSGSSAAATDVAPTPTPGGAAPALHRTRHTHAVGSIDMGAADATSNFLMVAPHRVQADPSISTE